MLRIPGRKVIFTLIPNPHHLTDPRAVLHGDAVFMVTDHFGSAFSPVEAPIHYERSVIALDAQGRAVHELLGTMVPRVSGKHEQLAEVPNSVLARMASFRLCARPYRWADFPKVALQPLSPAASAAPLKSQAAQEARSEAELSAAASRLVAARIAEGELMEQHGDKRDGISAFRDAVHADPNDAEAQYQLANALYSIDFKRHDGETEIVPAPPAVFDEAILHLRKALALRPNVADWHSELGRYLNDGRRYPEAVAEFRRALFLLPPIKPISRESKQPNVQGHLAQEIFEDHWTLGDALSKTRRYQEAIVHYQEALRLQPNATEILVPSGDALRVVGRVADARTAWKKAVLVAPKWDYHGVSARQRLAGR